MVRCPDCGVDNGDWAVTCNSCGRPLYYGHAVYEGTYFGLQRHMYSANLVILPIAVLVYVAAVSIPIVVFLAPEGLRLALAVAVALVMLTIAGIAYAVYRATSTMGPIQIGGQKAPPMEDTRPESISDIRADDPGSPRSIRKGLRPL